MLAAAARNTAGRGEPIPRIDYRPEEVATWGLVLGQLEALFPQHACKEVGGARSAARGGAVQVFTGA